MYHYKLVIFDWDGTLMDSIGRIVSSMRSAAKICLLEVPTHQQVKDIIGLSLPKAFEILFPNMTSEQKKIMVAQYRYQYVEGDNTSISLFDNALNLLTALKENNKKLAVATGKARAGLQRVFDSTQTEHFFHASRCADEALSKPDPQMLLSLLEEFKLSPDQAVMIGDTSHDLKMAQAAGIDSIGITLGAHSANVLKQYNPKAVIDSLSELQQLLIRN
ncbi:MAG: HAD-IA family hydrolase [Colwellia sp.]